MVRIIQVVNSKVPNAECQIESVTKVDRSRSARSFSSSVAHATLSAAIFAIKITSSCAFGSSKIYVLPLGHLHRAQVTIYVGYFSEASI